MSAPKLRDFLALHDEAYTPQGIKLSLGDSYLYKKNPVFKNIRDEFYKAGFTYTDKDFCHYAVLPYASLNAILKEKKVPYFDNVTVLKEIEAKHPGRFTCNDIIKVKPNYTLHESSHCVVDHFLKDVHLNDTTLPAEGKLAFKLVMAEAFANTVETLANLSNDSVEQRLFYELGSYAIHTKKVNQMLQQATDVLGPKLTFHLVYISYLYSNCLFPEPNNKAVNYILDLLIPDETTRKKAMDSQSVRKLFNHAFELSLDFRVQTTGFYCAFSGLKTDINQLLNIDINSVYIKTPHIKNLLKRFESIFTS